MKEKSAAFLRNPDAYLNHMVNNLKYDSCHKIYELNAAQCAKDCADMAHSDFAKNCSRKSGFFKCCIR